MNRSAFQIAFILLCGLSAPAAGQMSYDCGTVPDHCVSLSRSFVVRDIEMAQQTVAKRMDALQQISDKIKAGKIVPQSENYYVIKNEQDGSWQIQLYMYVALSDAVSATAFTQSIESSGYTIGSGEEVGC